MINCDCPGCTHNEPCYRPPRWSPGTLDGVVLPARLVALVRELTGVDG